MIEVTATPADLAPIEQGDPSDDGRAFRRSLGQFCTGVAVITVRNGDKVAGMAVNSFSAVSLDPPLILWSIRRESSSAATFLESGHFAVNVLAADQVEISQLFGASHADRFSRGAWTSGLNGAPLLEGAIAHFECALDTVHEGGDHLILVGRVQHYARFAGEPLLFAQGQYAVAQNHPQLLVPVAPPCPAVADRHGSSFLKLLSVTSQKMSALFQEHRHSLGVTPASARVLNRLFEGPCDLKELERVTYLGEADVQDAVAALVAQGQISETPGANFQLTERGRETSKALARRSAEFTIDKLRGIPDSEIAAATHLLQTLQQDQVLSTR